VRLDDPTPNQRVDDLDVIVTPSVIGQSLRTRERRRRRRRAMFDRLDFIYLPSRDVAADVMHFSHRLGAEVVFAIEAFGTRVAMVRLAPDPPPLLLAGHLEGDQPVLVYRVANLDRAVEQLRGCDVEVGMRFEIPHGAGAEVVNPGPQRVAVYERTRPQADRRLAGRRDF
jgi:hypothetical protein